VNYVIAGAIALVLLELLRVAEKLAQRALSILEHRYAAEHADREAALDRVHPMKPVEPVQKQRAIVVPPDIEAQLADAPEWEREDTRARAVELYEVMERERPDDKPADRWGRVHKLLEMETEAVGPTI
jgi:hypothetical protein